MWVRGVVGVRGEVEVGVRDEVGVGVRGEVGVMGGVGAGRWGEGVGGGCPLKPGLGPSGQAPPETPQLW